MLKGCGIERKQGEPARTSGPIQACPVSNFIQDRHESYFVSGMDSDVEGI